MRKFFPRFFNIVSLVLAILAFYPWLKIARYFEIIGSKINLSIFGVMQGYFESNTAQRIFLIPEALLLLSILFFIISLIDRKKSENKKTSVPIQAMALAPLYYLGVLGSISGILVSLFEKHDFIIQSYDFLGLGALLSKVSLFSGVFTSKTGALIFAVLLGINVILILSTIKVNRNGFFPKFIVYVLFLLFAILSLKGITDYYTGDLTIKGLFNATIGNGSGPTELAITSRIEHFLFLGIAAGLVVLYIIFGSVIAHKINVKMKEEGIVIVDEPVIEEVKEPENEIVQAPVQAQTQTQTRNINFIINIPDSRQVRYSGQSPIDAAPDSFAFEESNLDKLYNTEFKFTNVMMLRSGDVTSYYVQNKKFLTISCQGKMLTFRCGIEKAIKLLTEYPQVMKDRMEGHAIWFRVDDQTQVKKDDIIDVIKASYENTLLA